MLFNPALSLEAKVPWWLECLLPPSVGKTMAALSRLCPTELTHLGILVPSNAGNMANCNLIHVFKKLQSNLQQWIHLPPSLKSKVNMMKTNMVPIFDLCPEGCPILHLPLQTNYFTASGAHCEFCSALSALDFYFIL